MKRFWAAKLELAPGCWKEKTSMRKEMDGQWTKVSTSRFNFPIQTKIYSYIWGRFLLKNFISVWRIKCFQKSWSLVISACRSLIRDNVRTFLRPSIAPSSRDFVRYRKFMNEKGYLEESRWKPADKYHDEIITLEWRWKETRVNQWDRNWKRSKHSQRKKFISMKYKKCLS